MRGAPSMTISPSSAAARPARIFISVDFPAPFSPTSTSTSPARASSETSSSARTPGKLFPMPRISSSGGTSYGDDCAFARVKAPTSIFTIGGGVLAGEVIVE